MTPRRILGILGALGLFLVLVLVLAPLVGSSEVRWSRAFDRTIPRESNQDAAILFDLRVPRVLLAALVGAALAASGVALQALLRNFLATPFTLGITGGASFGAVLALHLGLSASWLGMSPVSFAASLGAFGAIVLVYLLGRSRGYLDMVTLLLAGVTINFFFSAVVLFLHFLADPYKSFQITRWLMGSLDIVGYEPLGGLALLELLGLAPILWFSRDLNLLSIGEEEARALGVDLDRTRLTLFLATSVATGAAVAAAGPIGFVGLIVPHALRLSFGPDNRLLLPASVLGGAAFLVLCDTLARTLVPGSEVPVGVLTAFLGCPFFLWLLRRRRREIIL